MNFNIRDEYQKNLNIQVLFIKKRYRNKNQKLANLQRRFTCLTKEFNSFLTTNKEHERIVNPVQCNITYI